MQPDEAWQDLLDKDDRTSPAEYPNMALITRNEFVAYCTAAERRGIERAAKMADEVRNSQPFHDDHSSEFIDGWKAGEHDTAEIIASAIRALAQPAGEKGEG